MLHFRAATVHAKTHPSNAGIGHPVDIPPAASPDGRMWTSSTPFAAPGETILLEEGTALTPKFDASGLVTAVVTDHASGTLLMVAHMNAEALARSISSGDAWYYSRSRKSLWRKGETSGHTQRIIEMRVDCDQDALWLRVEQVGPACHTLRQGCFYRRIEVAGGNVKLIKD
jgi:phosphoribosyl-AMP cyclohydrolase